MIDRSTLEKLYLEDKSSMMEIANLLGFSLHKISYWMSAYKIPRRTISEAIYIKRYPKGDPFSIRPVLTNADAKLLGLGLGLNWGEGTKANRYSLRLGNTDAALINAFIRFLVDLFGVRKDDMRFGLQVFTDINPEEALDYWAKKLSVPRAQFYKVHVTISGSIGTYRKKSKYGVLTVYYHNKKLRDIICGMLPR